MQHAVIEQMNGKMLAAVEALKRELSKIRTGRASVALLDGVRVEAYGSVVPLQQAASVTIPESRMIVIQPWDPQMSSAIERAILKSDIGLTPSSDGKVIRLAIPSLTEERRRDLSKQVKKVAEEYRVTVRNARRDAIETLKKQKKDKSLSEDELFRLQEIAQKQTDEFVHKVDEISANKEKEIMEI